jgi:hypothetical protein
MSINSDLVAMLRKQLRTAEESVQRWNELGRELHPDRREIWEKVARIRQLEIESLKVLIEQTEARGL